MSAIVNKYKPVLPNDGFGEWGLNDAILGCREGPLCDNRDPRRSCKCLFSRNNETFINRGLGVLNIVRFSRHRALK